MTDVAASRILTAMTLPTSVNGQQQQNQQQQQQMEMTPSSLEGDDQQASTCSAPDRQDVGETRPAFAATSAVAVDSAAETDGTVATTTDGRDSVDLSDDDNETKLVIDSSANYSSDSDDEVSQVCGCDSASSI